MLLRSGGEGCHVVRIAMSISLSCCLTGMNAPVSEISRSRSQWLFESQYAREMSVPLNLYSVGSLTSIGLLPSMGFSIVMGLMFSSCLRNGFLMIGMMAEDCGALSYDVRRSARTGSNAAVVDRIDNYADGVVATEQLYNKATIVCEVELC